MPAACWTLWRHWHSLRLSARSTRKVRLLLASYRFTTTSSRWQRSTSKRVRRAIPALRFDDWGWQNSASTPGHLRRAIPAHYSYPLQSLFIRKEEETSMTTKPLRMLGKYEIQARWEHGG